MHWESEPIDEAKVADILCERYHKPPVPLLVIGLGGTGSRIVQTIRNTFAQRFVLPVDDEGKRSTVPEHTAYLVIDTDFYGKRNLNDEEFVCTYSNLLPKDKVISWDYPTYVHGELTDKEKEWASPPFYIHETGVCLSRQGPRVMLNRRFDAVCEGITNALRRAVYGRNGKAVYAKQSVEIVICTGSCGFTGSALFLDIPQIIRYVMATEPEFALRSYRIAGYVVMPDVALRPMKDNPMADLLRMNGYAALKELDFWMNVREHKTPYTMAYGDHTEIKWSEPPFDCCYLMSGEKTNGEKVDDAMQVIATTIAEDLVHSMVNCYYQRRPEYDIEIL